MSNDRNSTDRPPSSTGPHEPAAIIFDLDGTLTEPYLDFDVIRAELNVTGPILEAVERMNDDQRARAEKVLIRHERLAAHNARLQKGTLDVIAACRQRGFRIAILTRNSRASVDEVLEKFSLRVDAIRTREDGAIKPSPEPVRSICDTLEVDPTHCWLVGDHLFDIRSGRAAGTTTVLLTGRAAPPPSWADEADYVISRLPDLIPLLDRRPRPAPPPAISTTDPLAKEPRRSS